MKYTNINIKSNEKTFKYIVKYENNNDVNSNLQSFYYKDNNIFFFNNDNINVINNINYWVEIDKSKTQNSELIPSTYEISSFNLYFPRFSVETYEKNTHYIFSINIWINDIAIYLGSYLLDRQSAIAPRKKTVFLNDDYYEYIQVKTINPFHLIYGDDWKYFRDQYCKDYIEDGLQKNTSSANINFTLTPVRNVNNTWLKLDNYDTFQGVITVDNKDDNNFFTPKISFKNNEGKTAFLCKLVFNSAYNNNLKEYLAETYDIDTKKDFTIKYCFVIGDKENPYKYKEHIFNSANTETEFLLDEFKFNSWSDYIEGMSAWVFVIIQKNNTDILVLNSNKIFITQEIFKYLLDLPIRNINLTDIDMKTNKFNVVNIVKNEIVNINRDNDYKSNIIKPIFIKVQDAVNLRLHYGITENICINLDAYKNKVNMFLLKIDENIFYESGRTTAGIVFKINGTTLPEADGTYYILDDNNEMVTTGKYTIIK